MNYALFGLRVVLQKSPSYFFQNKEDTIVSLHLALVHCEEDFGDPKMTEHIAAAHG